MARRYWIVSPNVTDRDEITVDWKKEILRSHSAMMGWSPNDYDHGRQMGPKFAGKTNQSVQLGDIILIARRYNLEPDVVGFGVVNGECREERYSFSEDPAYVRPLNPFIIFEESPQDVPLIDVLQHTIALCQLHPDEKNADSRVCEWMERQLESKDRNNEVGNIIDGIDRMESELFENPSILDKGESIIGNLFPGRDGLNNNVNVIPGGVPGKCHDILVVGIGSNSQENAEVRILEAVEHIWVKCPKTTHVLFVAAKWDASAWAKHANSFRSISCTLKMFRATPSKLD